MFALLAQQEISRWRRARTPASIWSLAFSIAAYFVTILLFSPLSNSCVFLSKQTTKAILAQSKDGVNLHRSRQRDVLFATNALGTKLRGGSRDAIAESAAATAEKLSNSQTNESEATELSNNGHNYASDALEQERIEHTHAYALTGVLNIPMGKCNGVILLSYKCDENPKCQKVETWGVTFEERPRKTLPNEIDATKLALAEVNGCMCHGIVINITKNVFDPKTNLFISDSASLLDDFLLCVGKGIIRREKGTQQLSIPVIACCDETIVDQVSLSNVAKYIEAFLERAVIRLWELQHGTPADHFENCRVVVSFSFGSAQQIAAGLARASLEKTCASEISSYNIVPQSLFGTLCEEVYCDMYDSWRCRNGYHQGSTKKQSKYWNILDITADDSTKIAASESADIRWKVESLMVASFADADERILKMEKKMDEESSVSNVDERLGKHPMPEFGSDVNFILHAMSTSFLSLAEMELLSKPDQEWVKAKRLLALKQLASGGICLLFRDHLQHLRDHFGRWYELVLESIMTSDFGNESTTNKNYREKVMLIKQQTEECFKKAAIGAIPHICRHPEGELSDELAGMFSFAEELCGLMEDLHEMNSAYGLEEEELENAVPVSAGGCGEIISSGVRLGLREVIKKVKNKVRKRGKAMWYERLALKFLITGINYIQGWIVLHAIKSEARTRDLSMPKFPLF